MKKIKGMEKMNMNTMNEGNNQMRNKENKIKSIIKKGVKIGISVFALFATNFSFAIATNDPIAVINNLSTFMFSIIRAIGMILLAWGIVQIGLALKSHDPSQRANGFFSLAGGIIITFAKEILNLIVGG